MWSEPYLETCCRAALHRLFLSGAAGRPEADASMKDVPCLARLVQLGCVEHRDGRFFLTAAGAARHAAEILRARG